MPALPKIALPEFYQSVADMKLVSGNSYTDAVWKLENKGQSYLFYFNKNQDLSLDLSSFKGVFEVYAINAQTGEIVKKEAVQGGKSVLFAAQDSKEKVLFVVKK